MFQCERQQAKVYNSNQNLNSSSKYICIAITTMRPRKTKMAEFIRRASVLVSIMYFLTHQMTTAFTVTSGQNRQQSTDVLSSKLYKQSWHQEQPEISDNFDTSSSSSLADTNEIITTSNDHHQKRDSISLDKQQHQQQSLFKSQQSYACGRAIATSKSGKYNNLISLQDQQVSTNGGLRTNKYRPFEIRTPRIIGGDETSPGEFPWTVSIKLNGQPICGGSLIDRSWILTAAHCVVGYNPKNLTVRLGAYRIKDMDEQQTIDSTISMFIVHKQYSMPRPFSNDIALLKVAEPIEFTDFIIPICLPTEDQVTTSTSNEVIDDYSKPYTGPGTYQHLPTNELESEFSSTDNNNNDEMLPASDSVSVGIVVSTKMSDKEIAKCFKRLEQNYLNSIGLGPTASESSQTTPLPVVVSPSIEHLLGPVRPSEATIQQQAQVTQSKLATSRPLASVTNEADTILSATLGNNRLSYGHQQPPASSVGNQQLYKQQQPSMKVTFLNPKPVTAEQFFETPNYSSSKHKRPQQHTVHYDLPWISRKASESIGSVEKNNKNKLDSFKLSQQEQTVEAKASQQHQQHLLKNEQAIKLTSLPISKELLREIQSVGSMQSLTLGLQQNDLVALADDLGNDQARPGDNSASSMVSANADRERVITSNAGVRQFVRTSSFDDLEDGQSMNTIDDPSKYSGMSGIVVGWGWVRENDNEEQQQTARGHQSVTLQKVRLPILRNNDCESWFRSQEKKITLLPSQFCAGFNLGGKDACRGDSGGPMIIEDNSDTGRYKLIGIVSAGIGCARPSLPGLYTRVASFIPWINAQVSRY